MSANDEKFWLKIRLIEEEKIKLERDTALCGLTQSGYFVGHLHGIVGSIDPLHRQLQRLPAAHRAHGGRGGIHALGLCRGGANMAYSGMDWRKSKLVIVSPISLIIKIFF